MNKTLYIKEKNHRCHHTGLSVRYPKNPTYTSILKLQDSNKIKKKNFNSKNAKTFPFSAFLIQHRKDQPSSKRTLQPLQKSGMVGCGSKACGLETAHLDHIGITREKACRAQCCLAPVCMSSRWAFLVGEIGCDGAV